LGREISSEARGLYKMTAYSNQPFSLKFILAT
jgi:hypothetical protein